MSDQLIFVFGNILFFAGFLIVLIAVALMFFTTARGKGKVKCGGAVIIGPFPVVFGTDTDYLRILILSVVFIVLVLIITVIFNLFISKA
jgi:uncharacterized protein (TIGR00304 family)